MARAYSFRRTSDGKIASVMPLPQEAFLTKNGSLLVRGWGDKNRALKLVVFDVPQIKRLLGIRFNDPIPEGATKVEFTAEDL